MKLSTYALDHLVSILIYLLFLICLELFLLIFDVHVSIMIASFVLVMLFGGALLAYEYQRRSGYYRRLFAALDQLDQKYLVHELTSSPSFLEGKLLEEILYETDKSMLIVGDNGRVELFVVNDIDGGEIPLLLICFVLIDARCNACRLPNICRILICEDVHHGPIEQLIFLEAAVFDVNTFAVLKRNHVDFKLSAAGSDGVLVCGDFYDHSSLYFFDVPFAFRTG